MMFAVKMPAGISAASIDKNRCLTTPHGHHCFLGNSDCDSLKIKRNILARDLPHCGSARILHDNVADDGVQDDEVQDDGVEGDAVEDDDVEDDERMRMGKCGR